MSSTSPTFVFCSNFLKHFHEEAKELACADYPEFCQKYYCCDFQFPDGEISAELKEGISASEIVIFQSLISQNDNDLHNNLFRLLAVIRAHREYGAKNITVFIPYLPYTRQDRLIEGEFRPLTSKLFSDLINEAGAQRVITLETGSITRLRKIFLPLRLDFISTNEFILNAIDFENSDYVLVAPDQGAAKLVKNIATETNSGWIEFGKRRIDAENVITHQLSAFRPNCTFPAVIIDDLICSGATVESVCYQLKDLGFSNVSLVVPHLRLTKKGIETINSLASARLLDSVITSNSVPHNELPDCVEVKNNLNLTKIFNVNFFNNISLVNGEVDKYA